MSIVYLLSGSNLGNRWENLCNAVDSLKQTAGEVTGLSPVYESPAWGFDHPSPFLNQAIRLTSSLSPDALLKNILNIENQFGRMRNGMGYEARSLDIDILFYDDLVTDSKALTIPHPRLHLRRFALLPLSAIAARLVHPIMEKTVEELLLECPDKSPVTEFNEIDACIDMEGKKDAI